MYFEWEDEDGDRITVSDALGEFHEGGLIANIYRTCGESAGAFLPRERAERLYDALGAWLYPTSPTPAANPVHTRATLNPSDVRSIVAEHVAEVVPLYLAGFAAARPCHHCSKTTCRGGDCVWNGKEQEADPEPRDVGHPGSDGGPCDAPLKTGQRYSEVHAECGYLWALHTPVSPGAALSDAFQRLNRGVQSLADGFIQVASAGAPTVCSPSGCSSPGCEGCLPECGVCGEPWSDGHGQPGDPCTSSDPECTYCGHEYAEHWPGNHSGACTRYRGTA